MDNLGEPTVICTERATFDEVETSQSAPRFQYQRLNPEKDEIRLVRLLSPHPTGPSDIASNTEPQIRCELIISTLSSSPEYISLSYAWGNPTLARSILLNDTPFPVTESLYIALRHLLDEEDSLTLWIDAICINQADDAEKSHQVQRMRDIYKSATLVVVFLGPSSAGTDATMDMLDLIGTHALRLGIWDLKASDLDDWSNIPNDGSHINTIKLQLLDFMHQFAEKVRGGTDPFAWLNRADLGSRSWFWRAWVLQETAVAKGVIFVCGEKVVEYMAFWAAWFFFEIWRTWVTARYDARPEAGEAYHPAISHILAQHNLKVPTKALGVRRRCLVDPRSGTLSLKALLCRANIFTSTGIRIDATDPRDRVYSFLGIANDISRQDLLPDYTKSCAKVYTEVALYLLQHGHLDILALCRSRSLPEPLPSWVPDWTAPNRTPWFEYDEDKHFSASGGTAPGIFTPDNDTPSILLLGLTCTRISTVQSLGPVWSLPIDDAFPYDIAGTIIDSISTYLDLSSLYTETQKEEARYRLPIGDISRSGIVGFRARAVPEDKIGYDLMRAAISDPDIRETFRGEHHGRYINYMGGMERLHDSRPFLSRDGHVGICPMGAQVGDAVFVVYGAKVPFVMREKGDGTVRLVGEGHVFGVMDGEYLEGQGGRVVERVVVM